MVSIIFVSAHLFSLHYEDGELVPSYYQLGQIGNYYYSSFGDQTINTEPWLAKTYSIGLGSTKTPWFKNAIRQRNSWCLITGQIDPHSRAGLWFGFQATYVFPLSHAWKAEQEGYGYWISL